MKVLVVGYGERTDRLIDLLRKSNPDVEIIRKTAESVSARGEITSAFIDELAPRYAEPQRLTQPPKRVWSSVQPWKRRKKR